MLAKLARLSIYVTVGCLMPACFYEVDTPTSKLLVKRLWSLLNTLLLDKRFKDPPQEEHA